MTGNARGQNYEFVVRGEIGDHFGLVFGGMRLERIRGNTVLSGSIVDQAHLHGLIERIQDSVSSWCRSTRINPHARKDRR